MITIVGVGALGSHVALLLRNEAPLKLVDFDRVEWKNTQSQFHTKMAIGKTKTQALAQAFLGLFDVHVESFPVKLKEENLGLLQGSKLVLDCTDNIAARRIVSIGCSRYKIPCLHGALSASGDFAQIMWDEHFVPDAEGGEGEVTCIDGEHLPFFASAAALLAVEAQRFLRAGKKSSFQLTPTGVIRVA